MNILQIIDPFSVCPQPFDGGEVSGLIHTEDNRMIGEAMVRLNNLEVESMTNEVGEYAFSNVPYEGSYEVAPSKDDDHQNGISTFDLLLMQRHILGIERFDSPYQIIAADINRSGRVDGVDIVELRKLVLGIYSEFPDNTSWRIIDEDHRFVDETNPFEGHIPENYIINSLLTDMEVNFIGVKVGDVSGDVIANIHDAKVDRRSADLGDVNVTNKFVSANTQYHMDFVFSDVQTSGFQFTLDISSEMADLLEVIPHASGMSDANVHATLEDGRQRIHFSWHNLAGLGLEPGEKAFSLKLNMRQDAWAEQIVKIDASGITPECYTKAGTMKDLALNFVDQASDAFMLYQNSPNPWRNSTDIQFIMPEVSDYTFEIYGTNGVVILSDKRQGTAGMNTYVLDKSELSSGGIFYYSITANGQRLIEKMLHIK